MRTPARAFDTGASDGLTSVRKRLRCAIYTRKSSEEGLEQSFNSLDAQREACEAYILSQKHNGWIALPTFYDDGGLSGGTMERPALKRLLDDVTAGRIDIIVVYKVDRLTRSLSDFARIVDTFDKHQVSFVSVTQAFNTTSSMGRLTLNVLLSFAQFEREIAGERIRDKIAASKRKGMWMGGTIPFGYQVKDRKLEIVESEAKTVRLIFESYAELGTVDALADRLVQMGITNARDRAGAGYSKQVATEGVKGDRADGTANSPQKSVATTPSSFSRGALHHMLKNVLYIGKVSHKGQIHKGQHDPIIAEALWTEVQQQIAHNTTNRTSGRRSTHPSLLVGKIETEDGQVLTPTHAVKHGVRYRYYANMQRTSKHRSGKASPGSKPSVRIPATAIERIVVHRLLTLLKSPTELTEVLAQMQLPAISLRECIQAAQNLCEDWPNKSAADQQAILQSMLIRVRLCADHVEMTLSRHKLILALTPSSRPDKTQTGKSTEPTSPDDVLLIRTTNCLEPSAYGMRLIIRDDLPSAPNLQLAPLIAQSFALRETIVNGPYDSFEAASKTLHLAKGYITSRIRLTYLSPRIIKKILDGDMPVTLSPSKLIDASRDLPIKWAEQERFLADLAR